MNNFFLAFLTIPTLLFAQDNYTAKIYNQEKEILPFTKIYSSGKNFNTDSLGSISGNLKIGDTLYFSKKEFINNTHIIKQLNEAIFLNEKYTNIDEVQINHKKYAKDYSLNKSKKRGYYSLRSDKKYAFLYKNEEYIVFNNMEIPIKFVSYVKDLVTEENTHFTIQFYSVENEIPKEPISHKINFTVNRKDKSKFTISLHSKIILPNKNFFLVIEVNEKSKKIINKKSYSFNPVFLCNDYGEKGSYLEYDIRKGEWEIIDEKKRGGFIFNLIIELKMDEKQ